MYRKLFVILALLLLGAGWSGGRAFGSPAGARPVGFIINTSGNSITVFDPLTRGILRTHDLSKVLSRPIYSAYDRASGRLYVGNTGSTLTVIDMTDPLAPVVVANVKPGGPGAIHWVTLADGLVWLAGQEDSTLYAYDPANLSAPKVRLGRAQGFNNPHGITLRPGTHELWVTNKPAQAPGFVLRVDTKTGTVIGGPQPTTGKNGDQPNNVVFTLDGRWAYVVNAGSKARQVTLMDTSKFTTVRQIEQQAVGLGPHDGVFDPGTRRLFVTNKVSGTVSAINVDTNTLAGYFAVGMEPHGATLGPDGFIYITDQHDNKVIVIDPRALAITAVIKDPGLAGPHQMVFTGMALAPPVALPGPESRRFAETGQTVSGLFLDYWNAHGGLMQLGYPISALQGEASETDGRMYTVQYFERAVLEYHPENAGGPFAVLPAQLGTFRYYARYGAGGAPGQHATTTNPLKFAETGKTLGGGFRAYWESHGGLARQGYPISDEFTEVSELDGKPYTVQYFERAVFEFHPENAAPYDVLLAQLGTARYQAR
jgi:YVTN family beta-propeller protein